MHAEALEAFEAWRIERQFTIGYAAAFRRAFVAGYMAALAAKDDAE